VYRRNHLNTSGDRKADWQKSREQCSRDTGYAADVELAIDASNLTARKPK
jgi:hypothetical protein